MWQSLRRWVFIFILRSKFNNEMHFVRCVIRPCSRNCIRLHASGRKCPLAINKTSQIIFHFLFRWFRPHSAWTLSGCNAIGSQNIMRAQVHCLSAENSTMLIDCSSLCQVRHSYASARSLWTRTHTHSVNQAHKIKQKDLKLHTLSFCFNHYSLSTSIGPN